jgi:UDP:flavonoid glycosyltransferase YjiC (YdhE family)
LQLRGHDLVWATGPDACARIGRLGIETEPAGLTEADFAAARAEGQRRTAHLSPEERPNWLAPWLFGAARAGPRRRDLMPIVGDSKPDLVVHDQAEYAAAIVASAAGVVHVTHGFGDVLPEVRVTRIGEDVAELWREAGLAPRPYGGSYDHLYLDIYPPSLAVAPRAHIRNLQRISPVPALASTPPPLPADLEHLAVRPLVYATLGTVFNEPGLLVSVVNAIASLPVSVVATVGFNNDPAMFGDQPTHVHVAQFVPQDDLLSRCAAVVSHGGSGTFLASLARGLPQVLLPQGADQFLNAIAAEKAGVAIVLRPPEQEPERVREALATILEDGHITDRAGRLAEEIARMPTADEVAAQLELLPAR